MARASDIVSAIRCGIQHTFERMDTRHTMACEVHKRIDGNIKTGVVAQFNIGLYSALVTDSRDMTKRYVCYLGSQYVTPVFGYSDSCVLKQGDEVIFAVTDPREGMGVILARKPPEFATDDQHDQKVESDTDFERRTDFFSDDCYRKNSQAYSTPLEDKNDYSARVYTNNRPTDIINGEYAFLNQHRCGLLGGMFSMSILGGGAHIRLSALENRIRVVADSIVRHTMVGNEQEWHNREALSRERETCLYADERMGMRSRKSESLEEADYHDDGYFTKNKVERQTAKPRMIEHQGYYGNLSARYWLRPDPDEDKPRQVPDPSDPDSLRNMPIAPGVARESVDPSGQYRFAATGMIGLERIGRIPVPMRVMKPWQNETAEDSFSKLTEFKHDQTHPFYRQLELADRVAYDMKNSYARLESEFVTPDEEDLEGKVRDTYDPGFSNSKTVSLSKYDKRRSGIWQGEDGSVIIRDAWGSEIVMIGGNIQLSCAGNVQIMPGKSSLTIAGDDIVQKAQKSIDIESADGDVRVNAYNNVQVMAGIPEEHGGGVTIEACGSAGPWDADETDNDVEVDENGVSVSEKTGGEGIASSGVVIKSPNGAIVTDTKTLMLRSRSYTSIVSGNDKFEDGTVVVSSDSVYEKGGTHVKMTDDAALILSKSSAALVGDSVLVAGSSSATRITGGKFPVPMTHVDVDDPVPTLMEGLATLNSFISDEDKVSWGYTLDNLEKMRFRFRSSLECGTVSSWEIGGSDHFTINQPFWLQVRRRFETLNGVEAKEFDDHTDEWKNLKVDRGVPWPGREATTDGKYAKLAGDGPVNMTDDGLNKRRSEVADSTEVEETDLFPGYLIRS